MSENTFQEYKQLCEPKIKKKRFGNSPGSYQRGAASIRILSSGRARERKEDEEEYIEIKFDFAIWVLIFYKILKCRGESCQKTQKTVKV